VNVFLSWSGPRSRAVASALHDWLPYVINALRPWMSAVDIESGQRWNAQIASQLAESAVGILCLTKENTAAPWLLFEAGALSKALDNAFVCPYLLNHAPSAISGPLAQFQAVMADKAGTKRLLQTLNRALGSGGLSDARLERGFETWWPELERTLASIPDLATTESPDSDANAVAALQHEIVALRADLARQAENMLSVLSSITARPATPAEASQIESLDIGHLEGVWRDQAMSGIYCARIVKGALRVAYSFDGRPELTGEAYNIRVVGDALFGRFRWVDAHISGYVYLRLGADAMTGGWWYDRDVPADVVRDLTKLNEAVPGMVPWVWKREATEALVPQWAEDFFAHL
jgi:hypothetical protein